MQKVEFTVKNRPSNEKAGITEVNNRVTAKDGTVSVTHIGQLVKTRKEGYEAQVVDTTADSGFTTVGTGFTSRSKAGHAIQQAFYASDRAQKVADRETRANDKAARKAARELKKADKAAAAAAEPAAEATA